MKSKRTPHIWGIILLILVMVLMAGCGKNTTPKIEVKANNFYDRTLVVATDDDYWPYVFYDENGQLSGHDIELVTMVANDLKMNLEIHPMTWSESLLAVSNNEADAVLTCEFSGDKLIEGIRYTSPVKSDDFVIFSKNSIESSDELYQKKIGIMSEGNAYKTIRDHGLDACCVEYASNRDAFLALEKGECDCVVIRYVIGLGILDELNVKDVEGYISLSDSSTCIGVNEQEESLVTAINDEISRLRINGTLERLNEKWIQYYYPEKTFQGYVRKNSGAIAAGVFFIASMVAMFFLFQHHNYKSRLKLEREHNARLEEEKNKAEVANVAKSTFLFNMSHDIRTPLNAIKGFNDMAIKNINQPEKSLDNLYKVQKSCDVLISLINNILDMSRIESGKATLHEKTVDIRNIFKDIRPMLEKLADGKSIILSFETEGVRDTYVSCDVVHTQQILVNLISNAIKYTQDGGRVKVYLCQHEEYDNGRGLFEFRVEDNGYGMSEAFRLHAFELFTREENSTTSGIQGTGLGLPLCKKLVEMMSGTISVESEQGMGSSFMVILPLSIKEKPDEEINEAGIKAERISLSDLKLLLVEDNEMNREIARDLLEDEGIIVDEAEDGRIAVDKLKQKGPQYYDIILMDIQMPYMNGYEATKAIRGLYPDRHIPIIALSANAFEEDKQKSLSAGMDDHIAKPIDADALIRCINQFL